MSAAPVAMMALQSGMQIFGGISALQAAKSARRSGQRAAGEYMRLGEQAAQEVRLVGQQEIGSDRAAYAAAGVNVDRGSPFRERTLKWDRVLRAAAREQEKYRLYAEGVIAESQYRASQFQATAVTSFAQAGMSMMRAMPGSGKDPTGTSLTPALQIDPFGQSGPQWIGPGTPLPSGEMLT